MLYQYFVGPLFNHPTRCTSELSKKIRTSQIDEALVKAKREAFTRNRENLSAAETAKKLLAFISRPDRIMVFKVAQKNNMLGTTIQK